MVAYLEKSTENADFDEIVDFLNANPIRYALTYDTPSHTKKVFANMRRQGKDFLGIVTPLFATMLIQPQADMGEVDETVHEERGDSIERAATTAASLDVEQDSGNIIRTQSMATLNEPIPQGTSSGSGLRRQDTILGGRPAQTRVLALENVKTAQDLEITSLKNIVKKLENKKKAKTPQLKRRLFKVRIESSVDKSLGDQEDASKQRRNIAESDQDEEISFVQEDAETQGRYDQDIDVTTISAPITTASVSVSTAEPSTPSITTTVIEDEDLIIAQTLMMMRSEKSKEKAKERGSKEKSSEPATRPIRGVTIQEPKKPLKKKDQIKFDEEVAKRLAEELEAELEEEERVTILKL
ncbi:hypothetical protein Tco_0781635 [Tanacetum coccineum]